MKRIYVDMDDVLCDFKGYFISLKNEDLPFPQSKIGFFLNLKPLPDAIDSFKWVFQNYDTWILTRPSFYNIHCYTEKAQWILMYLGFEVQKKLILCGDKSLLKGDYLIDDSGRDGQDKFEGEWIKFGSENFPDWKTIVEYLKNKI